MSLVIEQSKKFDATLESYHLLKYRNYLSEESKISDVRQARNSTQKGPTIPKENSKGLLLLLCSRFVFATKEPRKKKKETLPGKMDGESTL